MTRDDGKTWQNVTPRGIPEWIQINAIDASPRAKGDGLRRGHELQVGRRPAVPLQDDDYGKTWTKIVTRNSRRRLHARRARGPRAAGSALRRHRARPLRLLRRRRELAAVPAQPAARPITDLAIKNGDLVVATQGRAFWILDDLTPLRKWSEIGRVVRGAISFRRARPSAWTSTLPTTRTTTSRRRPGRNMPGGVVVDYWLKDDAEREREGHARVLRRRHVAEVLLEPEAAEARRPEGRGGAAAEEKKDKDKPLEPKAGVNRFVWDMRIVKPSLAPKAVFNEGTKNPPKVAPGTYSVRLIVDGKTSTQPIVVEPHPAGYATAADLKAQHELLRAIRDRLSETHDTVAADPRRPRPARGRSGARGPARERRRALEAGVGDRDAADRRRGRAHQPADRGRRGRSELRAEARPRLGVPRRASWRAPTRSRWPRRRSTTRC